MANEAQKKWQLLASRIVGRKGLHKTIPLDELKQSFVDFVKYYTENPSTYFQRVKQRQKGADKNKAEYEFMGDRVERVAPMTEYAFCLWVGKSKSWFPQTIANLNKMKEPTQEDADYLEFMLQLQTFFSSQLLEGAIVGDYNSALVASLLSLKNSVDVTSNGETVSSPLISIVEDKNTRDDYNAKN